MKTLTLKELRRQLDEATATAGKYADDLPVRVWLPGSTISLSVVFLHASSATGGKPELRIEGNIDEGSALSLPQSENKSPWKR
jgi:hypothetical protein